MNARFETHDKFESVVRASFDARGFDTHDAAYHKNMPREMANLLRLLDTPTALLVRTRPDRIALHRIQAICCEFECKTPRTSRANWAIEALPLANHILKSRLGALILYCYRDAARGVDVGFWCHKLPLISCVMMTPRGEEQGLKGYLRTVFTRDVIEQDVNFNFANCGYGYGNGTGTPFVIIGEATVQELRHWETEIDALVNGEILNPSPG